MVGSAVPELTQARASSVASRVLARLWWCAGLSPCALSCAALGMFAVASALPGAAYGACLPNSIAMQLIVHKNDGSTLLIDAAKTPDAEFDRGLRSGSFGRFVEEVTSRLSAELEQRGLCDTAKGTPVIEARFVHMPLLAESFTPVVAAEDGTNSGQCRITSPWLRLVNDPKATPPIRATFIWNERQVLFDQAALSGAPADPLPLKPLKPLKPLNRQSYMDFLRMYQDEEMFVLLSEEEEMLGPESKRRPLDGRVPADMLWLFRKSWQTTRSPFSHYVGFAYQNAMEQAAPRQAALTIGLVQRCLDARAGHHIFNTIRDTASIMLDAYRIRKLTNP